jgi:hypothetical protein
MRLLVRAGLFVAAGSILGVVVLTLLLNTPLSRPIVQKAVKAWIHPQLQIEGAVDVGLFPRLKVSVNDLELKDHVDGPPLLKVGQLRWQLPWSGLWSEQMLFSDVGLSDVTFHLRGNDFDRMAPVFAAQDKGPAPRVVRSFTALSRSDVSDRRILVDELTIERLTVLGVSGSEIVPLMTLAQLRAYVDIKAAGAGTAAVSPLSRLSGHVQASLQGLAFEEGALEGSLQAWLEQMGLGTERIVGVQQASMVWSIDQGVAQLSELEVLGAWGKFSSRQGTIRLETGEVRVPIRAQLTSGITLNTPGLQIRAARTDLDFLLTGKIGALGLESPAAQAVRRINR